LVLIRHNFQTIATGYSGLTGNLGSSGGILTLVEWV
jgi:hypothetical protein